MADAGDTVATYVEKISLLRNSTFSIQNSTFAPDADGVIPVLDGEWFEDDIVARIVVTHDHRTLDVFDRTLDVEDA